MRAAVVGHVEWVEFVRVEHLPAEGEIVHALQWWEEPGGGGSVAAVQLQKLTGDAWFFTAVGRDDLGERARQRLEELGLHVQVSFVDEPTRRAITHIDSVGERTITVLGERLFPRASDPLLWSELEAADAVYFTAGDVESLHLARRAPVLVATTRVLPLLQQASVELDALVGSAADAGEVYRDGDLDPAPRLVVRTKGADGGEYALKGDPMRNYSAAMPPAPIADRYGAGDSFAAGLTYALGAHIPPDEAVAFAARCGAAAVTGDGPYAGQLARPQVGA